MKRVALCLALLLSIRAEIASAAFMYLRNHELDNVTITELIFGVDDSHLVGMYLETRGHEQVIYKDNATIALHNISNWCKGSLEATNVEWQAISIADPSRNRTGVAQPWSFDQYGEVLTAPQRVSEDIFTSFAGADRIMLRFADGCGKTYVYAFSLLGLPEAVIGFNFTNTLQ